MIYKSLIKPLLFSLEAESAHKFTLEFTKAVSKSCILQAFIQGIYDFQSTKLNQNLWGLCFKNPIGLAAGFDKNGELPEIIDALGFGFTEVGSITANASTGNPKPRAFRLPKDKALINRMGLNNDGAKTIIKRLQNKKVSIPLGINIAKTHDDQIMGEAAIRDYLYSYEEAKTVADYITVNISCPNTSEGKTFEEPESLDRLLKALAIRDDASIIPTLVKFSPDLNKQKLLELVEICENHHIHGYVACNTSSDRSSLHTNAQTLKKCGYGGLSGKPIAPKSVQTVKIIRDAIDNQKPIIGVGGIIGFSSALQMMLAGADLLQIYTGLVYEGPGLVKKINQRLLQEIEALNVDSILQLTNAAVQEPQ